MKITHTNDIDNLSGLAIATIDEMDYAATIPDHVWRAYRVEMEAHAESKSSFKILFHKSLLEWWIIQPFEAIEFANKYGLADSLFESCQNDTTPTAELLCAAVVLKCLFNLPNQQIGIDSRIEKLKTDLNEELVNSIAKGRAPEILESLEQYSNLLILFPHLNMFGLTTMEQLRAIRRYAVSFSMSDDIIHILELLGHLRILNLDTIFAQVRQRFPWGRLDPMAIFTHYDIDEGIMTMPSVIMAYVAMAKLANCHTVQVNNDGLSWSEQPPSGVIIGPTSARLF